MYKNNIFETVGDNTIIPLKIKEPIYNTYPIIDSRLISNELLKDEIIRQFIFDDENTIKPRIVQIKENYNKVDDAGIMGMLICIVSLNYKFYGDSNLFNDIF